LKNLKKQIMKDSAINFFLKNKDSLANYIGKIKVNKGKTLVKYGYIKGESITITFIIYGQPDESINNYEDKVKYIFNSTEDLNDLNEQFKVIENKAFNFTFSPFLKISKDNEPLMHGFHISLKFNEV